MSTVQIKFTYLFIYYNVKKWENIQKYVKMKSNENISKNLNIDECNKTV